MNFIKGIKNLVLEKIPQWQNELIKMKDDKGQSYSPTYLRTIHAQLSSILNHACRYYNLKTNVARDVGTMGEKEVDEMSFWTQEEYESFIEVVKDKLHSYYALRELSQAVMQVKMISY